MSDNNRKFLGFLPIKNNVTTENLSGNNATEAETDFAQKIIYEFLDCFFSVVCTDSVLPALPQKTKDFCDNRKKDFAKFDKILGDTLFYETVLYINQVYNIFMAQAFNQKVAVLESYNSELKNEYIAKLQEYCKEKKIYLPKNFNTIVDIFDVKLNDEALHLLYYRGAIIQSSSDIKNLVTEFDKLSIASSKLKEDFSESTKNFATIDDQYKQLKEEAKKTEESIDIQCRELRKKAEDDYNSLKDDYNSLKNDVNDKEKRYIEYSITILGIFSAIVLTFNAGVAFTSLVLENLISATIYKSCLIAVVFGLILGNVILGMFAYLEYVRKKHDGDSKKRFSKITSATIWMNVLLIAILVLDFFAWRCDWLDIKNEENLETTTNSTVIEATVSVELENTLNDVVEQ